MVKIKKFRKALLEDDTQQTQAPAAQQQPQQANNTQQNQQQQNPNTEKVTKFLEQLSSGDGYWGVANYIPDELTKEIPDFKKGNKQAEPAINAWEQFKSKPSKQTYDAFINALKAFGSINNQENATQQNNSTQQQQQNVNAGVKAAYSFKKNLMENLAIAKRKNYYNSVVEDYFDKTEFSL